MPTGAIATTVFLTDLDKENDVVQKPVVPARVEHEGNEGSTVDGAVKQLEFGSPMKNTDDEDEEAVLAFSPSQCSPRELAFFGRRSLRKLHGQDPDKHRHLFTPPKREPVFKWPSNEEAERYVKAARLSWGGY